MKIQDKLDYSGVLFLHLAEISKCGKDLFNVPIHSDGTSEPSSTSKLKSYWGLIQTLQSYLYPSLSDYYFKTTAKNIEAADLGNFKAMQRVLQALITEASNKGYLFRQREEETVEEDSVEDGED